MNRNLLKNPLVLGAVALTLVLSVAPSAAAQAFSPGTIVQPGDSDLTPTTITTNTNIQLCFIDNDGDTNYDAGEPIVLRRTGGACTAQGTTSTTSTGANDIRLTQSGSKAAGTLITTADSDFNRPMNALNDDIKFYDANGNNVFDSGDTLYIDIIGTANNRVDVGDLRVTAGSSGSAMTTVSSGASDINLGIAELPTARDVADANVVKYFDVNSDTNLNTGDNVYFDLSAGAAPATVAVNDVRIVPFASTSAGSIVGADSADVTPSLVATNINVALCFIDNDGDTNYDSGEPIVLRRTGGTCTAQGTTSTTSTGANDLRLTASGGKAAGTLITTADSDFNRPMNLLNDDIKFYDANGNNVFDGGDTLYIDIIGTANNRVDVGDLRVTAGSSGSAMTTVTSGASDINLGIAELPTARDVADVNVVGYFDVNSDGNLNAGDAVYLDLDAGAAGTTIAVNDVRLAAIAGFQPGSVAGPQDNDVTPTLISTNTNVALCFIDNDGDTNYDSGEPIVLRRTGGGCTAQGTTSTTSTGANDLRLTESGGKAAGTLITTADSDFNRPMNALNDDIKFYDANGNNVFDSGDVLYIDIIGTANNRVDVGDLRVTESSPALTTVSSGASDINLGIAELPTARDVADGNVAVYFDVNSDGNLNSGDAVYLDLSAGGAGSTVAVNDVRLSSVSGTTGGGGGSGGDGGTDGGDGDTGNETADADGDGVIDTEDDCPTEPGTAANNGCPEETDSDGDGVVDSEDDCPSEAGTAANNGCPEETDSDGDGIPDSEDDCPDEAATTSDGCPEEPDPPADGGDGDDGSMDGDDGSADGEAPQDGTPGFGLVAALAAVAGAAALAVRRKD